MTEQVFTLTNFYIFLIEFAFSLLFLGIFTAIHYGITKTTKLSKKIEKSKLISFWYFFIFGFFLAAITFIVSHVSTLALDQMGMPLTILGLIYAMTIFYNKSVQIGAIIPTILWVLYQYNGFIEYNIAWLIRLIVVLVVATVSIATTFVKWKPWPTFLISCAVTFVALGLIIVFAAETPYIGFYFTASIICLASTIFYYAVIRYLNRLLSHMSVMAKQGAYIDKHYLIPAVLPDYFQEIIKKNNLTQALVVSLYIGAKEIDRQEILEKIHQEFNNKKVLFFKSEFDSYGLILWGQEYRIKNLKNSYRGNHKKTREQNDQLFLLEKQVESLQNDKVKLLVYVSIYGVHNYDLNDLLKQNHFAYKHDSFDESNNIIQLFNPNLRNQEIADDISFATLSQKINLNDISVELELLQMFKSKRLYVCPRFYWSKKLTCNVNTIMSELEPSIADTLLRSLAIKSLEQYANNDELMKYPLLIYYPINQLNNTTWSTANFIKKIKLYGLKPYQIILSFNAKKLNVWPKEIVENLKDLESHYIKYFLVDVINLRGIKNLHPHGIIVDESIQNHQFTSDLIHKYKIHTL